MIVAIEGIDASGKATHSKRLAERLGGEVVSFPDYSTPAGKVILDNLKSQWACPTPELNALVLQALMTINRFELLPRINALCAAGKPIVFDRYYASAIVYGTLDGLDPKWVQLIQAQLPEPDRWVLLDVPPEESVRRRPERRDRYEKQAGFMDKVRTSYLRLFAEHKWPVVHAVGTIEEVHERIWTQLKL